MGSVPLSSQRNGSKVATTPDPTVSVTVTQQRSTLASRWRMDGPEVSQIQPIRDLCSGPILPNHYERARTVTHKGVRGTLASNSTDSIAVERALVWYGSYTVPVGGTSGSTDIWDLLHVL